MPWNFFALTLAYSWGLWLAAVALGGDLGSPIVGLLYVLGGLGPSVGALLLLFREGGVKKAASHVKYALDFRSTGAGRLALVVGLSVIPNLASVVITERAPSGLLAADLTLSGIVPWMAFLLVVAVIEEMGWRGYALPRLLKARSALASSLILGFVWAAWHVPLFIIPGTWQHGLGFGTLTFWRYLFQIIPRTAIYTWVYVRNGNSLPSAVLFHALNNMSGELFDVTQRADSVRMVIEFALASILQFT